MGSVKAPLNLYHMSAIDLIMVLIFGIPIAIWAYHRLLFLKSPPYVKFEGYLRRKNLSWLLTVEELVIWIASIAVICLVFYICFNL